MVDLIPRDVLFGNPERLRGFVPSRITVARLDGSTPALASARRAVSVIAGAIVSAVKRSSHCFGKRSSGRRQTSRISIVAEAGSGEETVLMARQHQPDVVLMDLRMPGAGGLAAIRQLSADQPGVRVVVLTTYDSDADILRAVEAGATGYLLKDTPREELFKAIRATARGDSVLSPVVASKLIGRARGPVERSLSAREIEVLALVARGVSNKLIANFTHFNEPVVAGGQVYICTWDGKVYAFGLKK